MEKISLNPDWLNRHNNHKPKSDQGQSGTAEKHRRADTANMKPCLPANELRCH